MVFEHGIYCEDTPLAAPQVDVLNVEYACITSAMFVGIPKSMRGFLHKTDTHVFFSPNADGGLALTRTEENVWKFHRGGE